MVHELKRTGYRPRMCILSSREQTCIHDIVRTKPNKNDECIRLLDNNKCYLYRNGKDKFLDLPDIMPGGALEVFDIEELVTLATRERACPYFGMRSVMSRADIVFCPYNYLVDPVLREALDIDLTGAIIIIDEAHNIEDVCRSAISKEIKFEDLECGFLVVNSVVFLCACVCVYSMMDTCTNSTKYQPFTQPPSYVVVFVAQFQSSAESFRSSSITTFSQENTKCCRISLINA